MSMNSVGLGFLFTAKDMASQVMGKIRNSLHGLTGDSKGIAESFRDFGLGMSGVRDMFRQFSAGLAAFDPAITESRDLSKAIALVATESDEAVFPQEKMRALAEKLAVTYGKMPIDQANAMYKAVALGANDAAKAENFLNGVNLLSVAGNADLALSADALGGALNAYGAGFDKATDYSNAFFVAMKMGNTTVQDLASQVGRVTAGAASLNVSIEETLGAISVMTNKGIDARIAVSGLHEALANIVHPSAEATKEAHRLGIKFDQATIRSMGLQKFLQKITSSSKFTAESISKLFTSVEGSTAILQLTSGQMGSFNATMDAMNDKAGATQKGFEILSQTLDFQEQRYQANKKVALGMIGQVLEPMKISLLKLGNSFLAAFAKIPKPILAVVVKLAVAVAGFAAFLGAVIAAVSGVGIFLATLKAASISLVGVGIALLPITLALAAIGGALLLFKYAYENNLGGFANFVNRIAYDVKLVFDGIVQLFEQGGFSGAVRTELNKAGNEGFKQFAITVYMWGSRVIAFLENLKVGFTSVVNAASPAVEAMGKAFDRLGDALEGIFGGKNNPAKNAKSFDTFASAGEKIGAMFGRVVEFGAKVITTLINFGSAVIEYVGRHQDKFDRIGEAITHVVEAIGKFGSTWGQLVAQFEGGGGPDFSKWFSKAIVADIQLVASMVDSIARGIERYGMAIQLVVNLWTKLKTGALDAISAILSALAPLGKGIDLIGKAFGKDFGLEASFTDFAQKQIGDMTGGKFRTGPETTGAVEGAIGNRAAPFVELGAQVPLPAGGGASPPAGGNAVDLGATNTHLAAIANNTKGEKVTRVAVMLDGDLVREIVSKAGAGAPRDFNPSPVPT